MYEKLDRLRADVERLKTRIEDDKAKLKAAEQKLHEAENSQILADVGAMNLSPEQLAEFLQLVKCGQLNAVTQPAQAVSNSSSLEVTIKDKEESDKYEREDFEDED